MQLTTALQLRDSKSQVDSTFLNTLALTFHKGWAYTAVSILHTASLPISFWQLDKKTFI